MSNKSTKRQLTDEEINSILDFIVPNPHVPKRAGVYTCNKNKEQLKKQLKPLLVYPEIIPELKEEIIKNYNKSQILAGEAVGIVTGQSIGEQQTQANLSFFHNLSDKMVSSGVNHFTEILNASSNPKVKTCIVPFKSNNASIKELRSAIGHSISFVSLETLSKDYEFCSISSNKSEPYKQVFLMLYPKEEEFEDFIRFHINISKLLEYSLTPTKIMEMIEETYADVYCIFSPDHTIFDVYIDTSNISECDIDFIKDEKRIYLEEVAFPKISKMKLAGIDGIEHVFYCKDSNSTNWMVETDGSNFLKLLQHPLVDSARVISNNMWDIYSVLGIEATRQFLFEEFTTIMSNINSCHVALLVERMTYSGSIASISRYAMRTDASTGALSKASFEEMLDNLLKASVFCEQDNIKGVSASIITGNLPQIGTHLSEVKLDLDNLKSI